VVPIVPIPNKPDLAGVGESELAAIVPIQDIINKNAINMMLAGEFSAFRQKYATNITLEIDPDTGKPLEPWVIAHGGLVGLGGSGVVGNIARTERPHLTYVPERHSTHRSEVRLSTLPRTVAGVRRSGAEASIATIEVSTRDDGGLIPTALPNVWISKHGRYVAGEETFVHDRIDRALDESPLAGLVAEGETPYGGMDWPIEGALRRASFSGLPVVKVSRGTAEGFVTTDTVPLGIAGGNLSAPKARLLLMACLLRYGALPPAEDPANPTPDEVAATKSALAAYQHVFDTH
jgi:hypothetical protein